MVAISMYLRISGDSMSIPNLMRIRENTRAAPTTNRTVGIFKPNRMAKAIIAAQFHIAGEWSRIWKQP